MNEKGIPSSHSSTASSTDNPANGADNLMYFSSSSSPSSNRSNPRNTIQNTTGLPAMKPMPTQPTQSIYSPHPNCPNTSVMTLDYGSSSGGYSSYSYNQATGYDTTNHYPRVAGTGYGNNQVAKQNSTQLSMKGNLAKRNLAAHRAVFDQLGSSTNDGNPDAFAQYQPIGQHIFGNKTTPFEQNSCRTGSFDGGPYYNSANADTNGNGLLHTSPPNRPHQISNYGQIPYFNQNSDYCHFHNPQQFGSASQLTMGQYDFDFGYKQSGNHAAIHSTEENSPYLINELTGSNGHIDPSLLLIEQPMRQPTIPNCPQQAASHQQCHSQRPGSQLRPGPRRYLAPDQRHDFLSAIQVEAAQGKQHEQNPTVLPKSPSMGTNSMPYTQTTHATTNYTMPTTLPGTKKEASPNPPTDGTSYSLQISSMKEAFASLQEIRWAPPVPDATCPKSGAEIRNLVRRIYNALINTENCNDHLSTAWHHWYGRQYPPVDIERIAWRIMIELYNLHNVGSSRIEYRLNRSARSHGSGALDDESLRCNNAEETLSFRNRFDAVIYHLSRRKSTCDFCMTGEKIDSLISGPQKYHIRSKTNDRGNWIRNMVNKRRRGDAAEMGDMPEEFTGEFTLKSPYPLAALAPGDKWPSPESGLFLMAVRAPRKPQCTPAEKIAAHVAKKGLLPTTAAKKPTRAMATPKSRSAVKRERTPTPPPTRRLRDRNSLCSAKTSPSPYVVFDGADLVETEEEEEEEEVQWPGLKRKCEADVESDSEEDAFVQGDDEVDEDEEFQEGDEGSEGEVAPSKKRRRMR
ncbi:hypothetical protein K432DRAFT_440431 [Lepidopterella palustris CBS 459.81]|uniref:Uncharacterized protein n=1 Tax=Lepidopterella palustris CBS 459.81 TaxID=1314670 RepID=A0A8E2EH75_9PEZI|nr:hypothetical protein K432DRAFT_440431 [Lepidopterella palustris CBS 459.81]